MNDQKSCTFPNTCLLVRNMQVYVDCLFEFQAADNTWYSAKKKVHRVRTLKLLCMNPGIIFSPLATSARSIILASGTLTPTGSFQSELNTEFVHILNTAHVIPKGQVYATCVPRGPTGTYLRATYTNVNSWKFQVRLPCGLWTKRNLQISSGMCVDRKYQN